jgi:hypothetical protein
VTGAAQTFQELGFTLIVPGSESEQHWGLQRQYPAAATRSDGRKRTLISIWLIHSTDDRKSEGSRLSERLRRPAMPCRSAWWGDLWASVWPIASLQPEIQASPR